MDPISDNPATAHDALHVLITLRPRPGGQAWLAEVEIDGRRVQFPTLLALIGWLARLEPRGSGIR